MYTNDEFLKEKIITKGLNIFRQQRMKRRKEDMGYTRRRRYRGKRYKQKQKIMITKAVFLLLFIGCVAGILFFAWKYLGLGGAKEPTGPIVCIDAGHGGTDVGAVGPDDRYEKEDNLALALAVQKELESRDIYVLMTRDDDTKLSLEDRCYIANKAKAALFVSIHRNSASSSANGIEIWTANKGSGTQMAEYIYDGLKAVGMQTDRGIQSGTSDSDNSDYYVNKHTNMPSCLIEMGFITNEEDNRLLDVHMEEYAKAIADGIEQTLTDMAAEEEENE